MKVAEIRRTVHENQMPFVESDKKYCLLVGGRGAGKTEAGALKALAFCCKHPGVDGLILAPDYNRIQSALIPKYEKVFPMELIHDGRGALMLNRTSNILHTNLENKLYFRTTTDPDSLRGYSVGFIHDDECAYSPFEAFEAVIPCLRGVGDAQYWGTTTPSIDNPLNWVYLEFIVKEQDDHAYWQIATKDNPALSEEYVKSMESQLSSDLQLIELQGQFVPIAGNCYFDRSVLEEMLKDVLKPKKQGLAVIFKPPGIGKRYLAGIDVAEGKQAGESGNPDYSCLLIQDFATGEFVAEIHNRLPLEEFSAECYRLLEEYNQPFTGVEINFNKYVALKLQELGYPKGKLFHYKENELGWRTTLSNRMPSLSEYMEALTDRSLIVYSEDMIREHFSFVRRADGHPAAARNAHDDYVIAAAICWQMRKYARFGKGTIFPATASKWDWRRIRL